MPVTSRPVLDAGMLACAPRGGDAGALHRNLDEELARSYATLLSSVGSALGLAEEAWSGLVPSPREASPFSSDAYAVHWRLATGVAAQDVRGVSAAVEQMTALDVHRARGLRVVTVVDTPTDHAARAHLRDSGEGGDAADPLAAVDAATLDGLAEVVEQARALIAELDEPMAVELAEYVGDVRLFSGEAVGMTSMRFFGTIFLRVPEPGWDARERLAYFVDELVHETSHLRLHTLMALDPLVLNADGERHPAPLREDLRPLSGIYHATFVLARIARVFAAWAQRCPDDELVARRLEQTRARFAEGHATLSRHARLTAAGRVLLDGMRATAG